MGLRTYRLQTRPVSLLNTIFKTKKCVCVCGVCMCVCVACACVWFACMCVVCMCVWCVCMCVVCVVCMCGVYVCMCVHVCDVRVWCVFASVCPLHVRPEINIFVLPECTGGRARLLWGPPPLDENTPCSALGGFHAMRSQYTGPLHLRSKLRGRVAALLQMSLRLCRSRNGRGAAGKGERRASACVAWYACSVYWRLWCVECVKFCCVQFCVVVEGRSTRCAKEL